MRACAELSSCPPSLHLQACRWWEVDQPDVMAAKQAILRRAGASLSQADNAHASFQLRAASCSFTGADLVAPGWTQRLVSAGLDPGEPTLWHAEGLLNYLSAEGIQTMLQDAAQVRLREGLSIYVCGVGGA